MEERLHKLATSGFQKLSTETYYLRIHQRQVRVGKFHLSLEAVFLAPNPRGIEPQHLIRLREIVKVRCAELSGLQGRSSETLDCASTVL